MVEEINSTPTVDDPLPLLSLSNCKSHLPSSLLLPPPLSQLMELELIEMAL